LAAAAVPAAPAWAQVVPVDRLRAARAAPAVAQAAAQVETMGSAARMVAPMPEEIPSPPTLPAPMAAGIPPRPTPAPRWGWATRGAAATWARRRVVRLASPSSCWVSLSRCGASVGGCGTDNPPNHRARVLARCGLRAEPGAEAEPQREPEVVAALLCFVSVGMRLAYQSFETTGNAPSRQMLVNYFFASLAVWTISIARFCFIESATTSAPASRKHW